MPNGIRPERLGSKLHCYCQGARTCHTIMFHQCLMCCWCGLEMCVTAKVIREDGHGPRATKLVWPELPQQQSSS